MEFHFLPSIFPLIILITISYYQPQNMVFAEEEQYSICSKPFRCGNISEIDYPFWGSTRPSSCGHPDFHLSCSSQIASITISGLTYQVLKIDNTSQVLTVARTDYISDICPTHLQNATIDTNFFSTWDIKNVTIYYGCTSTISVNSSLPWISSRFTCNINGTDMSGYFLTSDLSSVTSGVANASDLINLFGTCKENVVVQANKTVVDSSLNMPNPSQANLTMVLDQGFGLKWDANNTDETCSTCKGSGGACGYDSSSSSFVCYCSDQAYMSQCNGTVHPPVHSAEEKDSNHLPLAIGLSIAGAAVVGLILGGWFMHRRKRKAISQTPSKELLSPSPSKIVHTPTNLSTSVHSYPYSNSKSDIEKGSTYFGVQVFSFTELLEASDNFDPAKEIGSGGFGTVYYGVLRDGRSVAVKRLFNNNVKCTEQFMNEVEILHRLRHPNLVTLHGCTSRRSKELILVYEYIPNGTVADHIHQGKSNSAVLTWPVRLNIAVETADALTYLHASDVIHRDVKTNNILLDNKFHVKVADFGLSRLFPNNCTHVSTAPQGTPGYVDPEYYHTYQLTDKSDVYSFGVVLIELISSLEAVDTNRDRQHINLATMAITKIQNQCIDELIDPCLGFEKDHMARKMAKLVAKLAFRCLQQERDTRPTMGEVLQTLKKIQSENSAVKAEELDSGQDCCDLGMDPGTPFYICKGLQERVCTNEEENEEQVLVELARIEAMKEYADVEAQRKKAASEFSFAMEETRKKTENAIKEIEDSQELESKLAIALYDVNALKNELGNRSKGAGEW